MYICIPIKITEPDDVVMNDIICGPVDVINQCNVTWNVSVIGI